VAKPFTFRLDTVRRVRELREREAQRRVAAKQAEIARLDALNAQAARDIASAQHALTATQRGERVDPTALSRGRAWIAHLRSTILQREQQKAALNQELQQLQDVWREARKQLKIIDKLRERRWQAHRRAERKREQAEMDETARRLHAFEGLDLGL